LSSDESRPELQLVLKVADYIDELNMLSNIMDRQDEVLKSFRESMFQMIKRDNNNTGLQKYRMNMQNSHNTINDGGNDNIFNSYHSTIHNINFHHAGIFAQNLESQLGQVGRTIGNASGNLNNTKTEVERMKKNAVQIHRTVSCRGMCTNLRC
jgi:UDP-N-acetylmuramyl pentapeptide synthase